jgi:hypothetical protein
MRLHRRKREPRTGDPGAAISEAASAAAEASERLAAASEVRAGAERQAGHEQRTIISELRAMRERNHLADLIEASLIQARRGGKP